MSEKKPTPGIFKTIESVLRSEKGHRYFKLVTLVFFVLCVLSMLLAVVLGVLINSTHVKYFALAAMVFSFPLVFYSYWRHKLEKERIKAGREVPLAKVTGKLIRKSELVYGLRNIDEPEMHEIPDYKREKRESKSTKRSK